MSIHPASTDYEPPDEERFLFWSLPHHLVDLMRCIADHIAIEVWDNAREYYWECLMDPDTTDRADLLATKAQAHAEAWLALDMARSGLVWNDAQRYPQAAPLPGCCQAADVTWGRQHDDDCDPF